ncbi:MAG: Cu2+-exporting ATPase [Planctomycetota bacterium]|jgi:Cu2+-exporting ATPase
MPSPKTCIHCGLPLPKLPILDREEREFCCTGCRSVYTIIEGAGLDDFYRLRGSEDGAIPKRSGRKFEEFDDDEFHRLYVRELREGVLQIELYVEGVHCSACIWLVEKLPSLAPGVVETRLDFGRSVATVTWQKDAVSLSQVARHLDALGYAPHPARGGKGRELRRKEERAELMRLGVAAALAMNAMLIAFALYGGILSGMEDSMRNMFRGYSFVMASLAVFWPGRTFLRGAVASLRTHTAHMDLPIALGLLAGLAGGAYNTFAERGEVYFESVAFLIFLLLSGRFIQNRQQRAARDSLELLHSLTPSRARRLSDAGVVTEVPVSALVPGDQIELRALDSVPADGRIVNGTSALDRKLLSGESRPVKAGPGDEVLAGTVNLQSRLVVEIESVGESTRLGQILLAVEQAAGRAAPLVRVADRMAGHFTVLLIALSLGTLWYWWDTDPAAAVENAVALLIVACPCALGLATPLAIVVAVGRAARMGILVQGGEVLERLAKPGTVFLDKTGTLTSGEMAVVKVEGDSSAAAWVHALESQSAHVLAGAILHWAEAQQVGTADVNSKGKQHAAVTGVIEHLGQGLEGHLANGSAPVRIGSPAFLRASGVQITPDHKRALARFVSEGLTPVLAAKDESSCLVLGLGDPLRDDAPALVQALARDGWRVGILSGDHPDIVTALGAQLELDPSLVHGGVSPEGKLALVESTMRSGPVVMVGDGVNDAAALAAATTGVAVEGGAEASLAAADVYLSEGGLAQVARLLAGSRRTLQTIHRGIAISLAYNAVAAWLAMTGRVDPILAAILMPVSSLTVVSLAYRAKTFRR